MKQHKTLQKYYCKFCNKGFPSEKGLKKHSISHSRKRPHVCDICQLRFDVKWRLEAHKNKHKEFMCNFCGEKFALFHIKENHQDECGMYHLAD